MCRTSEPLHWSSLVKNFPINLIEGVSYLLFIFQYETILLKHPYKGCGIPSPPCSTRKKQHFHFSRCKTMTWLAPSLSVNDLSMQSWLIYYKQGTHTHKKIRPPHSLGIYISPDSPTGYIFFGPAWFT